MSESTMLAVMGSSAAGKTSLCCKLAQRLSAKRQNVIVVFCDPFTPAIPYILPADAPHHVSLGELLTRPVITQTDVLAACVPLKENEYISLLGYKAKENLLNFSEVLPTKAAEFLAMLRPLADYVLIDCATAFEADVASIVAMKSADRLLRLGSGNLNGVSYFQSHDHILQDSGYRPEEQLKAVSNVWAGQEYEVVAQQYHGADFILPHTAELAYQYDELGLFEPLTAKESAGYNAEVQKILVLVFGLHEPVPVKGKRVRATAPAQPARQRKPQQKDGGFKIGNLFTGRKGEF